MAAVKQAFGNESLERTRRVALAFSLITGMSAVLQIDRGIAAERLVSAYAAMLLVLASFVATYVRGQASWLIVLGSGPALVVGCQSLIDQPAAIPAALAVVANQALYGSDRKMVVGYLGASAVLPTLLLIHEYADGVPGPSMGVLIAPVIVLGMLAQLLRTLYRALQIQGEVSGREALLASTSRGLLGVTDPAAAYAVTLSGASGLCDLTPGLGLAVLRRSDDGATVLRAIGLPQSLVGLHLPAAALGDCAGSSTLVAVQADTTGWSEGLRGRQLLGMRRGSAHDEILLVASSRPLTHEVCDVVHTMNAQLALVEDSCRSHVELLRLAHHDPLTTISNRGAFSRRLGDAVDAAAGAESRVGLLVIDLDDFKTVNDTLGHAAGDQVLIEVAHRLVAVAGDRGVAGRFGGDEFAVLMSDVEDHAELDRLAERLRDSLIQPIPVGDRRVLVGASIGVTTGVPGRTAGDLLRCADIAMYSAKAAGKNRVVRFRGDEHGAIASGRLIEERLVQEVDDGHLTV